MPTLDVYADEDLPAAMGWQIVSFDRCEWPSPFVGEVRFGPHPYDPAFSPVHAIVHDGDVLYASATVLRRTLTAGGREWSVAGVGTVFVFPTYRGQGHGGVVARRATELVDASGCDLGGLFCAPRNEEFYARLGWVVAPGGTWVRDKNERYGETRMVRLLSVEARAAEDVLLHEQAEVDWTW